MKPVQVFWRYFFLFLRITLKNVVCLLNMGFKATPNAGFCCLSPLNVLPERDPGKGIHIEVSISFYFLIAISCK